MNPRSIERKMSEGVERILNGQKRKMVKVEANLKGMYSYSQDINRSPSYTTRQIFKLAVFTATATI